MTTLLRATAVTLMLCIGLAACSSDSPTTPGAPGPPSDNLLGFYSFNSGGSDGSGNANHGTLLGSALASGTLVIGVNDSEAVSLPNGVLNGANDFSVAAWLKFNIVQSNSHQFVSGATAAEDNWFQIWYQPGSGTWILSIAAVNTPYLTNTVIEDNTFHHLTVVREGTSSSLYIDGVLVGTSIVVSAAALQIDPNGLIIGQDQDVVGGSFSASQSLAGEVDNLRIYRRALTAAEVLLVRDEAR